MNRLAYIDGLRGLFALIVAFYHYKKSLYFPLGYLAVDFFFILSGYILTYVYIKRVATLTLWKFILGRLSRLWPLHIFTLGLYIALYTLTSHFITQENRFYPDWPGNDFISFFENVFLIHNITLQETLKWNYPSWSISVEFFVNIALFFMILVIVKSAHKSWVWRAFFCFAVCLYGLLAIGTDNFAGHQGASAQLYWVFNIGLVRGFAGIILGMTLYKFATKINTHAPQKIISTYAPHPVTSQRTTPPISHPIKGSLKSILEIIFFVVLLFAVSTSSWIDTVKDLTPLNLEILIIFIFAGLLLSLSVGKTSLLQTCLALPPLVFLGQISYGIYLGHAPFLQFYKLSIPSQTTNYILLIYYGMAIIILGYLLHRFIEKPIQHYLKKKWKI